MYQVVVPFKDLKDNPRNMSVQLNLFEREMFLLSEEFNSIFKWRDSLMEGEERELDHSEVKEFYTNLEEILLASYGVMSEDGLYFDKSGRYKFEQSAQFNGLMLMFLGDQEAANKMIDGLLPKGMQDLIKKAGGNLEQMEKDPDISEARRQQIVRLRAELAEAEATDV